MTSVTCIAHAYHRVCVTITKTFSSLGDFMTTIRNLFNKSPKRKRMVEQCGLKNLPPAPSITRWGVWLECVKWYNPENLELLWRVLEEIKIDMLTAAEKRKYEQTGELPALSREETEVNDAGIDDHLLDVSDDDEIYEFQKPQRKLTPSKRQRPKSQQRIVPLTTTAELSIAQQSTPPQVLKSRKRKSTSPASNSNISNVQPESAQPVLPVKQISRSRRIGKVWKIAKLQNLCRDPDIRSQVAYVNENFSFISDNLKKLQKIELKPSCVFKMVEETKTKLKSLVESSTPYKVLPIKEHFDAIIDKNSGYSTVKNLIENGIAEGSLYGLTDEQKQTLHNARLVNDDPERIFSQYKFFYRDNRKRFKMHNIKMFITSKCILNRVSVYLNMLIIKFSKCLEKFLLGSYD